MSNSEPSNLVIVESPAKAKTIEKYLGADYTVLSSFGHIRDLPKKGLSIDKDNNFEPTYEISADKKKVVTSLRKAARSAKTVWLASDEDREGEAIAWHLCAALGLDPTKTKRIVFHEITKPAILTAIKQPRTVNQALVDAQQARRVLDRLVGYELSPVLWKKVQAGLSAGRVQSVAVRLIVEREREIKDFTPIVSYKLTANFAAGQDELKAELPSKLPDQPTAQKFLEDAKTASFKVASVTKKAASRNPSAPFTTSSLQQEAARRLGYSVRQTMTLAQRLYESGHITYMRTDSTNLSQLAIGAAGDYIAKQYGQEYHQSRQYKTKNAGAQEAHEAIRPTDFNKQVAGDDKQQQKLYDLIWRRALASQMSPAKLDRTEVGISLSNRPETLVAKGEMLAFDGFIRVYGGGKDDQLLPALQTGQELTLSAMLAEQSFSRAPARYSEASLVKKLEELGIGRPSTYAPTISTIQTRGYVEKSDLEGNERTIESLLLSPPNGQITSQQRHEITGADKGKLLPTHTAEMTTDFLVKYFASIVDYDFTAKAETNFDAIADGKQAWQSVIQDFYSGFHPLIEQSANVSRQETSQARALGDDPKTGKPIVARYGRYGAMLQMGATEDEAKPRFAPLPSGSSLDTVTLEQALEMFKLPRQVGTTEDGQAISANIGRFGPYVQVGKTFVSIKGQDPLTITEAEARAAYAAKLEKDANKYVAQFASGVSIVNGPYGPYVTDGKKNARIPKDTDPTKLTEAECQELIAKAPAKKRRGPVRRKTTKK